MRITDYKQSELSRLCEINDICFEGLERPPYEDFKSILSVSEVWTAKTDAVTAFVDDFIIGYVIVKRDYGAYLWQIAVDPGYRRRGVASYLLSHAEQWCKSKGDDVIRLHCHVNNPSQKLYFDRGYRTYDLAHGYYGEGTLALMMQKGLK